MYECRLLTRIKRICHTVESKNHEKANE